MNTWGYLFLWDNDFWNAHKIMTLWFPSADPGLLHLPNAHSWHLRISHNVVNIIHKKNKKQKVTAGLPLRGDWNKGEITDCACQRSCLVQETVQLVSSVWPRETGKRPLSASYGKTNGGISRPQAGPYESVSLSPRCFRQSGLRHIPRRL